ncbi:hypothetical protein [Pseudoclavibacter sp. JSM 162008]|uniref:hypothetical protein n=1 Tax=Pseudoclavibacter sp. JSM 162008 TaxID=3229855 RepID=UPI003523CB8E
MTSRRNSPARWKTAGLGVVATLTAAFALTGCTAAGSGASSESATGTFAPAPPASSAPPDQPGGATEAAGDLIFAATADDRHSWITAEARVSGVTRSGTCEYTASAEGVDTITRTAKALASNYDTVCGDISFELGTPGTYTITVTVTEVTDQPLTASTDVEFLGASAD